MDRAARPRRGAPPGRPEAPGAPSGPIGSPGSTSAIGAAIRSLGTPDFPAAFARMAASDFLADQVVVFRAGEQGRIRTLLAENLREGAGRALALAESYASRHWARDPNRHLLLPPVAGEERRGVVLRAVRVEEIADAEYRRRLFAEPRLRAKAALVVCAPGHALYVNLYRGLDREPFGPGDLAAVERTCDVLAAMLERHFALADDAAASDLAAVQRVIAGAAVERGRDGDGAPLSEREAAVCARIVAGYSAEGIGLDLGVSTHSVVTYRRRAFEKLGIATQKELFSLVLRRHRLLGG
jgi:DNA-binding CsgD family transcriptional regulator